MSRKNKNKPYGYQKAPVPNPKPPASLPVAGVEVGGIGKKDGIILSLAVLFIAAGYVLLGKADPAGSNICSNLAPAALLAGYLLVFLGLRGCNWSAGGCQFGGLSAMGPIGPKGARRLRAGSPFGPIQPMAATPPIPANKIL